MATTSAVAVSRMIGKAGIRKQEIYRSKMVRGWADFTEGYVVEQCGTGVIVKYDHSSSMRYDREMYAMKRDSAIQSIVELLTSKGYEVTVTEKQNLFVKKAI